jgi:hypothetical protein
MQILAPDALAPALPELIAGPPAFFPRASMILRSNATVVIHIG